jgi:hypothetical protein
MSSMRKSYYVEKSVQKSKERRLNIAFTRTCTPSLNLVQGEKCNLTLSLCDVPLLQKERCFGEAKTGKGHG